MDAEYQKRLQRTMRRLNNERRTVIDHLQSRSRQLDVALRMLRRQLADAGIESDEICLYDKILPVGDGTSLHSEDEVEKRAFHDLPQTGSGRDTEQKDWWPSFDDHSTPLKPSPGWQNIKLLDEAVRTVGILLLGQSEAVIDRVVATFLKQQTQRQDFTPVFIIDSEYIDPFLQTGFVVEMIPPAADQALYSGTRPWEEYVMDQLVGIREKWFVVQFLEFGKTRYQIDGMAKLQESEDGEEDAEESSLKDLQDNSPLANAKSSKHQAAE